MSLKHFCQQKFAHISIDPRQIFFQTEFTFAIVNLKPVVWGHILVIPKQAGAQYLHELEGEHARDLFLSVQVISERMK